MVIEGKLAGVSYPSGQDALARLKGLGIKALLNLSEVPLSPSLLTAFGMLVEHIPIADFT